MVMRTLNGYTNGYLERRSNGRYEGELSIEGVDLSPIIGVYFKDGDKSYLWLKRKTMLEYDNKSQTYKERQKEPRWQAYLQKQVDGNGIAYRGEFVFFHFKFEIYGIWDNVLGMADKHRLNLFVDRLPMKDQTIILSIIERKLASGK